MAEEQIVEQPEQKEAEKVAQSQEATSNASKPEEKKKMGTGAKIAIGCGVIILLGIVVVVILAVAGVSFMSRVAEDLSDVTDVDFTEQENDDESVEESSEIFQLGETVTVDDIEWVLVDAENIGNRMKSQLGEYGEDCVAKSGEFIQLTLKAKNNRKEMATLSNLYLYDSEGREFVTSSDVIFCVEDDMWLIDNINPGIERTFLAVYEVPEDASGFKLKVGNLDMWKTGHEYISLGF